MEAKLSRSLETWRLISVLVGASLFLEAAKLTYKYQDPASSHLIAVVGRCLSPGDQ